MLLLITGCSKERGPTLFETISPERSGVTFSNDLESTSEFNILNYLYFYDGGGVSIGDVNNDGLADLYFTANMQSNELYLNQGDFKFLNITKSAGVSGDGDWTTGTTMADVNGDGLLDIYICNVNYRNKEGRNQLFINNGDSTFTEQAAEYGLNFQGYSKQAAFLDYDMDGDLDLYLLNHAIHSEQSFAPAERRQVSDSLAGDRLYRNDGNSFTNVTKQSGIYNSVLGYGLAVTTSDLNNDGCPDLYVSNDFHENDYLYLNNCDGTFREVLESSTGHTSRASMGNDIADFNNDGLTDIYVADMLPSSEEGMKTAVSSETYKVYTIQRDFGYHPQLIQNTLQFNRGVSPDGELKFSEIAQYAGVNATDWSWAPLFLDMNNDGFKDIFITNGIYRRPNNLDYLFYVRTDSTQQDLSRGRGGSDIQAIKKMPHTKLPNVGFINSGQHTFSNRSDELGFRDPGYSNGAAYGDLDNDGDLDLVTNNVNGTATIKQNMTSERKGKSYLKIALKGDPPNTYGIGSTVMVHDSSSTQKYELYPTRGFQSSVEPKLTIGLGDASIIDSVTVIWPDGRWQRFRQVKSNQQLAVQQSESTGNYHLNKTTSTSLKPLFTEVTSRVDLDYTHREDTFTDFNAQQLAPFMLATQGPAAAVGDVNSDGREDFFIGGARRQAGRFFLQESDTTFREVELPTLEHDSQFEDVDAELFDANGDGTLDLYVVSGGNEFPYQSEGLRDRFYFNDRNMNFLRVGDAFPAVRENGAVAKAADYDNDGDMDLFVGSRSIPQNYGVSPDSHLFENQGNGKFEEVTDQLAPGLRQLGMVTDARWADLDFNGAPDLIVSGEWMPVAIFLNQAGKLVRQDNPGGGTSKNGWWQSIETGDFDNDGDIDFIAGNMGTNSFLKASPATPIVLYIKDFNDDGQIDPIVGYTKNGKEYPVAPRDELLTHFKFLRTQFDSYQDYAGKTLQQIFGNRLTEGDWEKKTVTNLQSMMAENNGDGTFTYHPLPGKAQWSPIMSTLAKDFDGDEISDLLIGGNFYEVKPSLGGRFDAGYGLFLKGMEGSGFQEIDMQKSGFFTEGEVRDILSIEQGQEVGSNLIMVVRNNLPMQFFVY